MSSEAKITSSLVINGGNAGFLNYQSLPATFTADCTVAVAAGSTPGSVLCTVLGTLIDLTELTNPGGLCRLQNLDSTNYIEIGLHDAVTGEFYPVLELLPGESFIVRLARFLGEDQIGTGSGVGTKSFYGKGHAASVALLAEAFNA